MKKRAIENKSKFVVFRIIKSMFFYIVFTFINLILIVFIFDYLLLPIYVNKTKEVFIPNVIGQTLDDAKKTLKDFNLEINYIEYDKKFRPLEIVEMDPRAWRREKLSSTIKLNVINYPQEYYLKSYTNESFRSVSLEFDRKGLIIDTVMYSYDYSIPRDHIISIFPEDTIVLNSSWITALVSKGPHPDYYIVPELMNTIGLDEVKKKINKAGLKLGNIQYRHSKNWLDETVIDQTPLSGKRLSFPDYIDIIFSTTDTTYLRKE